MLRERAIEYEVIPFCELHEIAVVAYSPFGHGEFPDLHSAGGRVLKKIADEHHATPRQVALRFLVRRPMSWKMQSPGICSSRMPISRTSITRFHGADPVATAGSVIAIGGHEL